MSKKPRTWVFIIVYIVGWVQDCSNSSANVLELPQWCAEPSIYTLLVLSLQWRHNECGDIWNHRRFECLFNHLFRRRSKKTSKLCVTGLCERNPPVTRGFPSPEWNESPEKPWYSRNTYKETQSVSYLMRYSLYVNSMLCLVQCLLLNFGVL